MRAFLYRGALFWISSIASAAQPLPGNVQLGMSADQLHQAIPTAKRITHPSHMAGGLIGSWSGPVTEVAGVSLTPTFFFSEGELRRIEYVAQAADPMAAFGAVRAWGRTQWGRELASEDPQGEYATWAADEMDVYLQMTSAQHAQVRLVIKRRLLKDASQL